jgi:group I intron endonuclease
MHFLYKITNQLNGKIYIGQSKNDKYRWRQHLYFAKNPNKTGQYIHHAMAKYGAENFEFQIIAFCRNQEDANNIENTLILQYNSRDTQFGYNLTVGGNYGGHSEETKRKLSEATKQQIKEKGHPSQGVKRSEEARQNMSAAQQNRNNNYTPEMRKRMSDSHKGQKHPSEVVEKRKLSLKATNDAKIVAKVESGELKCNAPGCEVGGIDAYYKMIDSKRYCAKHGMRLQRNGTLELQRK